MRPRRCPGLLLGLALAGCVAGRPALAPQPSAAPAPPPAAPTPPAVESPAPAPAAQHPPAATAEDDDLREVVLRHLFQHNASGQQGSAGIYCIAVEGQADPSPTLLARFSRHTPRVLPASACSADASGVEEAAPAGGRGSVARGLLFRINRIQRIGPDRANVDGGYYEGGLSASGNSYVVVREGGRWIVKSERMNWISQRSVPTRRA